MANLDATALAAETLELALHLAAASPMQLWARQAHREAARIWAQCPGCNSVHPISDHHLCRDRPGAEATHQ